MIDKKAIAITACATGGLAVMLGAFGSHGLKGHVSEVDYLAWQTAVQYQFYHTFALFILAAIRPVRSAFWLFLIGMVFFSGSLYAMVGFHLKQHDAHSLGILTPMGGLALIGGWMALGWSFRKL